jgi:hypothetical protein
MHKPRTFSLLLFSAILCQCGAVGNLLDKATEKSRGKKQAAALAAFNKAQQEEMEKSVGRDAVGQIVSVDVEGAFVLIRNLRPPGLAADVTLDVKEGSGARVRTCPAAKAGFIAADILKGTPVKGEIVVLSKEQQKSQNAADKYMPDGLSEEQYWQQRRADLPPLTPVQAPEGNAFIPDAGQQVLPEVHTPEVPAPEDKPMTEPPLPAQ